MDLIQNVFDVIDFRSFSNAWYWMVVAVLWSTSSYWVVGVPYDLIQRAEREHGDAFTDMQAVVIVYVRRTLTIVRQSAVFLIGFMCFILAMLITFAVFYQKEFAQALLLLMVPLFGLGALNVRTALKIEAEGVGSDTIFRRLRRHRLMVQAIGMFSIFITATYGMFYNLAVLHAF